MYKFKFAIGDWSDDGHGKCDYHYVISNKPVEEVRELHYNIKKITGVDIDNMCSNYRDSTINIKDYLKLIELGFDFSLYDFEKDDYDDINYGISCCDTLAFVNIWIFLLKLVDKNLEIEIEDIPMFQFYGVDKKNRHIHAKGYGLFY